MTFGSPEKAKASGRKHLIPHPEIKLNLRRSRLPRFLIAAVVSLVAGIALDNASNNSASAQSDVYPLSVDGYCNNTLGIGGEPYVAGNAWHCANGRLVELEFVCKAQHAFDFHAYNPTPDNPYSWGCTKDTQTNQLPPSVVVPEYPISPDNNYPSSNSSPPEANLPSTSFGGGLDFAAFCSSLGKGAPYARGRDWYCTNYSFIISPEEVCDYQYGRDSRAVNPDVMNASGWTCEGGTANSNPPANNTPSNPTEATSGNNGTENKPAGNTPTTEQVASIQIFTGSSSPPTSGDYLRVTADNLNIRGLPGTDQPILGQVRNSDYYPLVEVRGDWGLITGSYGAGWVYLSYTEVYRQTPTTVLPPTEVRPNIEGNTFLVIGRHTIAVNPRTCAITNGAEIIKNEISYFEQNIPGLIKNDWYRTLQNYFGLDYGELDQLKNGILYSITHYIPNCTDSYYLVGDCYMDLSGLGNVIFGYYAQQYPQMLEDAISNYKQLERDGLGRPLHILETAFDFPDDRHQRLLGRTLADTTNNASEITTDLIISTAVDVDLQ